MSKCGSTRRSDSEQAARKDGSAVESAAPQAGRLIQFNLFSYGLADPFAG